MHYNIPFLFLIKFTNFKSYFLKYANFHDFEHWERSLKKVFEQMI